MFSNALDLITSKPLLTAFVLLALCDATVLIWGLLRDSTWFVKSEDGKRLPTGLTVAHVIAWTVLPPAWFFFETYVLDSHLLPTAQHAVDPKLKAAYDSLRLGQELAKNFWAAILAAILFLVPKK